MTMKRQTTALLLAALLTACAGAAARKHALWPAIDMTWPAVRDDVDRGIAEAATAGDVTSQLEGVLRGAVADVTAAIAEHSEQHVRLVAAAWPTLDPYARRGIAAKVAAGEVGEGVASSLSLQVDLFGRSVSAMAAEVRR